MSLSWMTNLLLLSGVCSGVKKALKTGEIDSEILLQAPLAKDIHIDMLVEHDLTKVMSNQIENNSHFGDKQILSIILFSKLAKMT